MRIAAVAILFPLLAQDGATLYRKHCATCHDAAGERVPSFAALKAMPAAAIRLSLETGKMREQAAALSNAERDRLANFLGTVGSGSTSSNPCQSPPAARSQSDWSGWSPGLTNNRQQTNPGFPLDQIPRLKLKWAFHLGPGVNARSQPAVLRNRLYIGAQSGAVHALDAATGCSHWTFQAAAQIRSGIVAANNAVFFGDGKANVYALHAATGKLLWQVKADPHPYALITGTVQFHNGILYVPVASFEEAVGGQPAYPCCTFRGSLLALDAATGRRLWQTYTIAEPPRPTKTNGAGTRLHGPSGAAVWSTPTIDGKAGRIYIATGDNYSDPATPTSDAILALDLITGRLIWSKQITANDVFTMGPAGSKGPDHDLGQSPILVDLGKGKRALVFGQKSGVAHAIDPDAEGKILWQSRVGNGGTLGGIQWGSAADNEIMYVAVSDVAFTARRPDPQKGGGLHALQLATGERLWSVNPGRCLDSIPGCSPGHSAAVSLIPGALFAGSLDGHIRALSAADGKVLWDFDTTQEFQTVNNGKAKGGSIDGPGPVLANGMLFTNSGYGSWGGIPGSLLLAFSIDGK
jgi:polyvinyl alcohol dehydrogenase (cytochrome)